MIINHDDFKEKQIERLSSKTQDHQFINAIVKGTGASPWEAEVMANVVHEIYHSEPSQAPLRAGQLLYSCISRDQGAGKALKECQMVTVVLTQIHPDDLKIKGASKLRQHKILRLTEEAREQNGLLTQEDLAQLLSCDLRTIGRDIQYFRNELKIHIATRGHQKDIGPGVSHRGIAIRHWLEGKEPPEVARAINHSLHAVERYLNHFCRIVFLAGQRFNQLQIAFTIGISAASVRTYLDIYQTYRGKSCFRARFQELQAIGGAHFEGGDQKKGRHLPNARSNKSKPNSKKK